MERMQDTIMLVLVVAALGVGLGGCDDGTISGTSTNAGSNSVEGRVCAESADCGVTETCMAGRCVADSMTPNSQTPPNSQPTCANPSPCGDCDPYCQLGAGPNAGEAIDLEQDDTDGLVLDDQGNLTLGKETARSDFIWIANTGEGTISKIDTKTYTEVARYVTGPDGAGNDPSRTSVNAHGDVFVGNRGGESVTMINSLGDSCPDQDGDGVVTTSTGPQDVKPWGSDECIIWHTPLKGLGLVRAVAAQNGRRISPDETLPPVVWIGSWQSKTISKLDAKTGEVLLQTSSPTQTYGFALDGQDNLWISGLGDGLGRLNTFLCRDQASCDAAQVCDSGGDPKTCVKQRITTPERTYGITVDFKQRIWLGGDVIARFDPTTRMFAQAAVPGFTHGITADANGNVFGSVLGVGVARVDSEDLTKHTIVKGTEGSGTKGIAVDYDGKVWSINRSSSDATVIVPGPTLEDNQVVASVSGLVTPYTYSDMTGQQLRFVSDQFGFYRTRYDGCQPPEQYLHTAWKELRFAGRATGNAKIVFMARASDSVETLEDAAWVEVGALPGATSPIDLQAALEPAGMARRQYLEVEARLSAERSDPLVMPDLPVLERFSVTFSCPLDIR